MSARSIGYLQIIFAGFFFGFLGLFGKVAYQKGFTPGELLALRFSLSAVLLFAILIVQKQSPFSIGKKNILLSSIFGILGYAVFSSCYFYALEGISASLTVLLLYIYPILVSIGAAIFLNEKFSKTGIFALILSSVGMIFLVWGEWSISKPIYLIFGILSAVFYGTYILLSRKLLSDVAPIKSSFFVQLGAGVALCLLHFDSIERPILLIENNVYLIIAVSIVCSAIPLTLFLSGLQKIPSSQASILSTTEPISAILIASLALGERLLPMQIFGGVLILAGVILVSIQKRNPLS